MEAVYYYEWRFTIWYQVGLDYSQIDDLVDRGILKPGESVQAVKTVLQGNKG